MVDRAYVPAIFLGEANGPTIQQYLESELMAISRTFAETQALELRPVHVAPARPREGMIVYADGSDWNPGAGKGVYVYTGTAWSHL